MSSKCFNINIEQKRFSYFYSYKDLTLFKTKIIILGLDLYYIMVTSHNIILQIIIKMNSILL